MSNTDFGLHLGILFNINRRKPPVKELPIELWLTIFDYLDLFSIGRLLLSSQYFKTIIENNQTTQSILRAIKNTKRHIPFERLNITLMRQLAPTKISDAIKHQVNLSIIKKPVPKFNDKLLKLVNPLTFKIKWAVRDSIDILFIKAILVADYSIIDYCVKFFKSTLYDWYIADDIIEQILKHYHYYDELNLLKRFINKNVYSRRVGLQLNIPFLLPIIFRKFKILRHINDLNYRILAAKFSSQNRFLTHAKYISLIINAKIGLIEYHLPPTNDADIFRYLLANEIYDHYNYIFFDPTNLFKNSTKQLLKRNQRGFYLGRFNTYASYQYITTTE